MQLAKLDEFVRSTSAAMRRASSSLALPPCTCLSAPARRTRDSGRSPIGGRRSRQLATEARRGQTYIEQIVSRHAVDLPPGKTRVYSGEFVTISPKHVMTHDNTGPVISKFASIGASKIHNPRQPVFTLDHDVQNMAPANLKKYAAIERFAQDHDVDFFPAGRGIGHQIMIEEGYAFPGEMTVASDSHTNMYGGVGCVGTPIVRTDAAALWATGKTWWQVPPMVRVELTGRLAPGVTGKDVIVALCGTFAKDEVLNSAIEFVGEGVATLSVDERLTIANMTTEWGALVGVFPVDDVLRSWYADLLAKLDSRSYKFGSAKAGLPAHPRLSHDRLTALPDLRSDADAVYAKTLTFDLSSLVPHVSGPNSVKVSTPLAELEQRGVPIQKAYLVSCTNSRASDLRAAADVLRGRKVADGVELYVAAASSVVQREAEESGDWAALVGAGAKVLPAGCGPCIGLGTGLLKDGETGISATNRNYKGRMGSPKALAYLASPAVVAASAVAGRIAGPESLDRARLPAVGPPRVSFSAARSEASADVSTGDDAPALLPGFPAVFRGELLWAPQDNLNTDALYPGKYTYQDDITPERQAEVVMENYDPAFASMLASFRPSPSAGDGPASTSRTGRGVLLCAGLNFGTGSSREQAATALRNAGIPLVLAASFGDIFKRNAINNGLICIEAPDLVRDLAVAFASGEGQPLTHRTHWQLEIDTARGQVTARLPGGGEARTYRVGVVGQSVQEVWIARGLEQWVKERI